MYSGTIKQVFTAKKENKIPQKSKTLHRKNTD